MTPCSLGREQMASHDVAAPGLLSFLSRFGRAVEVATDECDAAEVFAAMEPHLHRVSEEAKRRRQKREEEEAAAEAARRAAEEEAEARQAAEAATAAASSSSSSSIASSLASTGVIVPTEPAAPLAVALAATSTRAMAEPPLPPPPRTWLSQAIGSVLREQWAATEEDFLQGLRTVFWSLR